MAIEYNSSEIIPIERLFFSIVLLQEMEEVDSITDELKKLLVQEFKSMPEADGIKLFGDKRRGITYHPSGLCKDNYTWHKIILDPWEEVTAKKEDNIIYTPLGDFCRFWRSQVLYKVKRPVGYNKNSKHNISKAIECYNTFSALKETIINQPESNKGVLGQYRNYHYDYPLIANVADNYINLQELFVYILNPINNLRPMFWVHTGHFPALDDNKHTRYVDHSEPVKSEHLLFLPMTEDECAQIIDKVVEYSDGFRKLDVNDITCSTWNGYRGTPGVLDFVKSIMHDAMKDSSRIIMLNPLEVGEGNFLGKIKDANKLYRSYPSHADNQYPDTRSGRELYLNDMDDALIPIVKVLKHFKEKLEGLDEFTVKCLKKNHVI